MKIKYYDNNISINAEDLHKHAQTWENENPVLIENTGK